VKGRLSHTTLAAPELPLAGEQAQANNRLNKPVRKSLPVVLMVVLQDTLHVVRVSDEIKGQDPSPETNYIAEPAGDIRKRSEGIPLYISQVA
jgi:hypothetical protein